jgi:hypothetical protein
MSLPVKKIYIDSQYKTDSSLSSSQFTIEFPYSLTMPHNAIFTIDEISIPHAWYTIETSINDRLYIQMLNTTNRQRSNIIATVAPANYNGTSFKVAVQAALDAQALPDTDSKLVVDFDPLTYTIGISNAAPNYQYVVLSDVEVANGLRGLWAKPGLSPPGSGVNTNAVTYGGYVDVANIASINDVLRNLAVQTTLYGSTPYRSGFLNFNTLNNLYLSSPNLGTFTTMGTRGESTIIKKVPVSAEYGYMIIDRSASIHDYLECGKCSLKTVDFELKDSRGRYVPLHGANISFSIVFAKKSED